MLKIFIYLLPFLFVVSANAQYSNVKDTSFVFNDWEILSGGEVQTTDATVTTAKTFVTTTDEVYLFSVCVTALESGATNGAAYQYYASFKNDGGTVSEIGSETYGHSAEDDGTWGAPEATFTGTSVIFRVTGLAATTIDYKVVVKLQRDGI